MTTLSVRTTLKFNYKIVERGQIDTLNIKLDL